MNAPLLLSSAAPATRTQAPLQLYLVPAGRRLDFTTPPGQYAYVYRRLPQQAWQCIAQNACSPFLDRTALPMGAVPEYQVRYRNAAGTIVALSTPVQAIPASLPASPNWTSLR
ncbi:hypothetical protein [Hymenobacter weizhouensis]|uniref:hypothetical protein n=1 Tax=Hymenobacter sp. YIM 151500-1 TaxID=2987689 RepID=UPI00222682D2|nr:hypothetical protein [Hymenobacter sp. YIM 151500-1]UYZ63691.1 hypothetical protein OIS53_02330 [Hymenobacter sp. YIM 151500-1]